MNPIITRRDRPKPRRSPGRHFSRSARDLGIGPSTLKRHLGKLVYVELITKVTALGHTRDASAGAANDAQARDRTGVMIAWS